MVDVIVGDLLEAEENIIVHQVNCQGKMNSGIAKQIRNKYPKVYSEYYNNLKGKNLIGSPSLLGFVQFVKVEDKKYIANLFSQLNYGYDGKRYTNYEAIYTGLSKIKRNAKEYNLSVAIPYNIGSDRGGADWDIVYKMIEKIFEDYKVKLYKLGE